MHDKRKRYAATGIVCLVVAALAMGWFIGQYIPGTPKAPESTIHPDMYNGIGSEAVRPFGVEFGETIVLDHVVQGERFYWDAGYPLSASAGETGDAVSTESLIAFLKEQGWWEHEYPPMEVGIAETRLMSARSFSDWYPDYQGRGLVLDDCMMVLVTLSITNASDELMSGYLGYRSGGAIPESRLWVDGLAYTDGTLGSGIVHDPEAFSFVNEPVKLDEPIRDEAGPPYIHIAPDETQDITVPFVLQKNTLADPDAFDDLKASDLSLLIPDFRAKSQYRFWLG